MRDFIPDVDDGLNVLNSPTARQMLIYQTVTNQSLFFDFQDMLYQAGYPQETRNVSVSNGNQAANSQPFSPGDKLLNIDNQNSWVGVILGTGYHVFGTGSKFDIDVWALSHFPSSHKKIYQGDIKVKLFGLYVIDIGKTFVEVKGTPSYDDAPGGEIYGRI